MAKDRPRFRIVRSCCSIIILNVFLSGCKSSKRTNMEKSQLTKMFVVGMLLSYQLRHSTVVWRPHDATGQH